MVVVLVGEGVLVLGAAEGGHGLAGVAKQLSLEPTSVTRAQVSGIGRG